MEWGSEVWCTRVSFACSEFTVGAHSCASGRRKRMMEDRSERSKIWRATAFLMIFVATLLTGGIALAGVPGGIPGGIPVASQQGGGVSEANITALDGRLSRVSGVEGSARVEVINVPEHTLDMTRLGLRPIQGAPPRRSEPDGGAIGTQNAYMIVSPDVVSQSTNSAIGTLLVNFTPAESVNYYLNGSLAGSFSAAPNRRGAVALTT